MDFHANVDTIAAATTTALPECWLFVIVSQGAKVESFRPDLPATRKRNVENCIKVSVVVTVLVLVIVSVVGSSRTELIKNSAISRCI